jgi:hypothetical protein
VEAKNDRDGGDPTQFTIGPSVQFYLKPLINLKRVKTFDLDDSKSRALVLEAGVSLHHRAGCPARRAHGNGCYVALSTGGWIPPFGP